MAITSASISAGDVWLDEWNPRPTITTSGSGTYTTIGASTPTWHTPKEERLHEIIGTATVVDSTLEYMSMEDAIVEVKKRLAHQIAMELLGKGLIEIGSERVAHDAKTIFYAKVRVADNKKNNEVETLGKITTST